MNTMLEMGEFTGWLDQQHQQRRFTASALAQDSHRLTHLAYDMARRFSQGGRLITFGNGRSHADAQHIAVEFVHPVIVGKRALPSLCLSNTPEQQTESKEIYARQLHLLGRPSDMAIGISHESPARDILRGLEAAKEKGLFTLVLAGEGPENSLSGIAHHAVIVSSREPHIIQETQVTIYHILWELVHAFLEHPQVLQRKSLLE